MCAMVWGYGLWAMASLGCLDRNNSRRKEAIEFIQQKAAAMIKSSAALPQLPLILSLSSAYSIFSYNGCIAGIFMILNLASLNFLNNSQQNKR